MLVLIQPLTGGYLSVTEWGKLVATPAYDKRSVFELSGDGSVPTLARSVAANAYVSVAADGSVTVAHTVPDLFGSALEVHPGALHLNATVSFLAQGPRRWLSASGENAQVTAVELRSPGSAETFKLWAVPFEVERIEFIGADAAAGVANGSKPPPAGPTAVGGWRHCRDCGVLFDSNGAQQACPGRPLGRGIERLGRSRAPSGHIARDETIYRVSASDDSKYSETHFLRRCHACSGLTTASSFRVTSAPCASGASDHPIAGSLRYAPRTPADAAFSRVTRWRICEKCALLFRDDGGPNRCAGGGSHDPGASAAYDVERGS